MRDPNSEENAAVRMQTEKEVAYQENSGGRKVGIAYHSHDSIPDAGAQKAFTADGYSEVNVEEAEITKDCESNKEYSQEKHDCVLSHQISTLVEANKHCMVRLTPPP